jgi:glycosyltransferase involved in cell wall biosynthesis
MQNELVTVCITTYNRKELLLKALKSLQEQTYNNLEIIIVDDASTDGTEEIILSIKKEDQRIKYIKHSQNKRLAAARNTAIFNASGKYFSFIDDDDEWDNRYIEEFVQLAQNFDDSWCFCCGVKSLNNNMDNIPQYKGTLKEIILMGYTPPVSAQFYFTSSLLKINGYNENINSGVDHDLWIRLAIKGLNIQSLPKALSIPNKNPLMEQRMTINYKERLKGIKKSLEIWKDDLTTHFDSGFYKHFCKDYIYHIHKKILLTHMKNRSLIEITYYFILLPEKIRFIKDFSVILKRKQERILKSNITIKNIVSPKFKPFKKSF